MAGQAIREGGKIHWGQCRGSVEDAVAFWRPPRITFVFAHGLSAREQDDFRTELVEKIDLPVVLDFMPESEVQRRLRDTPEGRQAATWLFAGSELEQDALARAYAMGGELRDAEHAAERLAEIGRHLDKDPHLDYTAITNKACAPETLPAEGTALSVVTGDGDREVRFDAREKFPGALEQLGLEGAFVFTDDEIGRQARESLVHALRGGHPASIDSGIGLQMKTVPVGLRGLMTDEPVFGQVTVTEVTSHEVVAPSSVLVGIVASGGHELGIAFFRADDAVPGWDGTLVGAAGGLEIFHSIRGKSPDLENRLDWRHTFGRGSAVEQLLACRILRGALLGETVQLLHAGSREQIWLSAPVVGDYTDDLRDLEIRERILELAAEVEIWTECPLVVPATLSSEDVEALVQAAERIRSPELRGRWQTFDFVPDAELPTQPVEVIVLEARRAQLFGAGLFLGVEQIQLPLATAEAGDDGVRLAAVPGHEEAVAVLHRPSRLPAEAALPPGRKQGGRVLFRLPSSAE